MPKKKLGNAELVDKYITHITDSKKVSQGTISTYKNVGKNLTFNILTTQPVIMRKLKALYNNPNTLQLYLNMIILLRRYNNEETDKLVKMRNGLRDDIIRSRKEKLENLNGELPDYKYLIEELDKRPGKQYVINYLMVHHALRNKDINLKFVKTLPKDTTENYVFVKGKTATLYITDYKTENKYGDKTIKITDPKFINALRTMQLSDGDYILPLKNGSKITSTTTFNDKIVKLTIDALGQNKIAKIVIKHLLTNKSFSELERLSKDRGTSLEVMLKSYNLHNTTQDNTEDNTEDKTEDNE
jgi:hypothetical protein